MRFDGRLKSLCVLTCVCLDAGCSNDPQPKPVAPAPSSQPPPALDGPAGIRIQPESAEWTREAAVANLSDETLALSAAVRLVRLAGLTPLSLGQAGTDTVSPRVRLVRLEGAWVIGLADRHDDQRLRAPILIAEDGAIALSLSGLEEEVAVLHIASDPDVFPTVVTTPRRVIVIESKPQTAIQLAGDPPVRFELRKKDGFPYIGLLFDVAEGGRSQEVARYVWDPYELMFAGPGAENLPEPPGGVYEIDLKCSPRLNPVGGVLPDTQPVPNKPPPMPIVNEPSDA
jgi:hypothetical protein